MKEIKLGNCDEVMLVSDCDYEWVSQYHPVKAVIGYVVSNHHNVPSYFHKMIVERMLGGEIPKGFQVDHANGNRLDNRRENLRCCTKAQNMANIPRHMYRGGSSQYKGVAIHRHYSPPKWKAQVSVNNKTKYLGLFNSEEDAARAYDKAAKELWGEYAWLNFPDTPRSRD